MHLKSVLVTGCSAGGIGAALAHALAKKGHHVFATARNTSKIPQELLDLSNVTIISLDVSSMPSVSAAARVVAKSGHGLDVLVNNAGAGYATPILDIDVEKAQQLYDTNVWGCVRTIQAFADLLIASRGRIVNVSSIGGTVHMPWISAYASSKSALTTISETLRMELSPFGVSVVTIMGGVISSNFDANNADFCLPPDSRYHDIEDIIAGWATGKVKPQGSTAAEFAESCVGDILGQGKGGLVWRGANAGAVRFLVGWLPKMVVDLVVYQNQGLRELSKKVLGGGKQAN
ncbi:Short-chain dehydrogenase/reductase (SDR) family protein [Penicillium ucsense]|uniref:Short-chain dehydrogenase/reductase (SDR) family protein n=1 Tax=Penicillium ucsense TaxID=2839758 RepID=A0A8J8W1M7_9EURO|nr:Short-chain dehydrogenase/reductase (SDR) family protein [Penicillium ucsense]KAF7733698.1 Short-chain dehydrogenase/reductase (SDR) family protein [Penicillium ucsense]